LLTNRRHLAWTLLALTVAALGATIVIAVLNRHSQVTSDWGTSYIVVPLALCSLSFPAVGAAITLQRPENSIGWICLGIGMAVVFTLLNSVYAQYTLRTAPGSLPGGVIAGWIDSWSYMLFVGPLGTFLPLLFPNGRLPSRRWRIVAVTSGISIIIAILSDALNPGPLVNFPGVDNPFGIRGSDWLEVFYLLFTASLVASAASVVVRFHGASHSERQRIKWFAYAAIMLALVFAITISIDILNPGSSSTRVAQDAVTFLFSGLPIAIGIAILRNHLYDIDRVINRTVVYGVLTALLALCYFGLIVVSQQLLTEGLQDSPLVVAASTLVVAALFRPALTRIQGFIDRRFDRRKYDAVVTIEAFNAHLREEIELDTLSAHLLGVVKETMQPAHVSLWLPREESLRGRGSPASGQ
jgi:hypothetical protein